MTAINMIVTDPARQLLWLGVESLIENINQVNVIQRQLDAGQIPKDQVELVQLFLIKLEKLNEEQLNQLNNEFGDRKVAKLVVDRLLGR